MYYIIHLHIYVYIYIYIYLSDVKSPNSILHLEIQDKSTQSKIGHTQIPLSELLDQQKIEKVLYLKPSFSINNPSQDHQTYQTTKQNSLIEMGIDPMNMILSLRLRFFWSKLTFFKNQIEATEEQIEQNTREMEAMQSLLNKLTSPFALVVYGYLDDIKENDLLELPKAKEDILEKKRLTILPKNYQTSINQGQNLYGMYNNGDSIGKKCFMYSGSIDKAMCKGFDHDINWNSICSFLLYVILILTFCQTIERSDLLGICYSLYMFLTLKSLHLRKTFEIVEKIRSALIFSCFVVIYDVIWLVISYMVR